jgi:hypothetical protein
MYSPEYREKSERFCDHSDDYQYAGEGGDVAQGSKRGG